MRGEEVPQLQAVFDEVEQAVLQHAGRVLDKMDKYCKATAVLRLGGLPFREINSSSLLRILSDLSSKGFAGASNHFWSLLPSSTSKRNHMSAHVSKSVLRRPSNEVEKPVS